MHCTCKSLLNCAFTPALSFSKTIPPTFLLPAFSAPTSSFSTSANHQARKDGNPSRGVSALRHTGLGKRQRLSVKLENLPKPVLDPAKRSKVLIDENHGLWDFFPKQRTSMATPPELNAHGRAWTVPELRNKDWDDLHRLWWTCLKELNRINSSKAERERVGNMYGAYESDNRKNEVKKTQKAIKHTLTERWYAWENAREEAMSDPEINMYANVDEGEPAYIPRGDDFEDDALTITGHQTDGSTLPLNEGPRPGGEARV